MEQQIAATGCEQGSTYRISDLVAASGVSRDMIKYYLRAKLLPPAKKPRPNLALYSDSHLALIELIQKFQQQTKLSLSAIARVFSAAGYNAHAIEIELLSARHSVTRDDNIIPLQNQPAANRELGLPADFVQRLVDGSLLTSTAGGENENQLAALLWAAHDAGVPLAFFEQAQKKVAELADLEVKTLIAIKRPDLSFKETVANITAVDRIINRWMIKEKNLQIREQFQRVIDNSERASSTLLETIYRPSHLFRERYRVEEMLSSLSAMLDANPPGSADSSDYCLCYLLLGEYRQTIRRAEAALNKSAAHDITIAFLTLAHGMQNNVEQAFAFSCQLENSSIKHPIVLQARILSLLLKAAQLGGVADTAELMKQAGELFLELPGEPRWGQAEETLLLARANVAFPDFANSQERAIRALDSLLEQIDQDAIELPAVSIDGMHEPLRQVYRIYALYYLGVLHRANGNESTCRDCFEQVLQIDPASNFGEIAYRELGSAT